MSGQQATWLYAVVPARAAGPAGRVTGLAGEPPGLVVYAPLAAVVGTVELPADGSLQERLRDPRWLEGAARAHHAVVAAYASAGPTAPLRLATVYRDDDRVRAVLRRHTATLAAALDLVAGRAEWGVQAYPVATDPAQPPATAPAATGPAGTARSGTRAGIGTAGDIGPGGAVAVRPGTAYLQRRRAEQAAREHTRRRTAAAVAQVHEDLCRLAVASTRHPAGAHGRGTGGERPVLNASYLVDRDRADRLARAVEELARAHPSLRLRLTGPWPAYSFVEIEAEECACGTP